MDVALGGQGAPVAPIADSYLYPGFDFYLNLGGIANLTAFAGEKVIAFDVCPANQILDALAREAGKEYDSGGALASSGWVNEDLLHALNRQEYHALPYPKTLDNAWSRENLLTHFEESQLTPQHKLRTAVEYVTHQIHASLARVIGTESFGKTAFRLFASGGGAHNTFLMRRLQEKLEIQQTEIVLPAPALIDFKEAALMAFMAVLRVEGLTNVLSSVTGASRDSVGGAVWRGISD
jgi:anhydro-N-acetylmuramic acid kinase